MDKKIGVDQDSPQEEGNDMSLAIEKTCKKKTSPLDRLKQRAETRKNRSDLKHFSSEKNAKVFNENFLDIENEINKTIK